MLAWLNLHNVYVEARDKNLACLNTVFGFSAFWDVAAKQNLFPLKESVYVIKYTVTYQRQMKQGDLYTYVECHILELMVLELGGIFVSSFVLVGYWYQKLECTGFGG